MSFLFWNMVLEHGKQEVTGWDGQQVNSQVTNGQPITHELFVCASNLATKGVKALYHTDFFLAGHPPMTSAELKIRLLLGLCCLRGDAIPALPAMDGNV